MKLNDSTCLYVHTAGDLLSVAPSPVDGVSIRGPDELLQQVLDVPAQPLIFLLQVKHLIHQQQHYPQRDVIIHLDAQINKS